MAHELENLGTTRESASFVSARQHAWHQLGTVLPAQFDAADAMRFANLGGWNVRKVPVQTVPVIDAEGVSPGVEIADTFATVRTNPVSGAVEPLGVVGGSYRPVQNEAHADILNTVVDEGGAHFETAGSLRGGRQVFLSMKVPATMMIGGVDPVDLYLIACNSHDGSSAFRLLVSPVRVVCANTQAAALASAKSSFSIRHTSGAAGRISQAREALRLAWKYAGEFQAEADRLIEQNITDAQFDRLIAQVWPAEESVKVSNRRTPADDRAAELRELRRYSPTISEGFRGTKWAAYQVITEYVDFLAPMRSRKAGQVQRAERAVIGTGPAVKSRAFDLIAAL